MKLYSIIIFKHIQIGEKPILLCSYYFLDDVGYFKRGPIEEVCLFVSRLVVQKSSRSELKSIKHNDFFCHVRVAQNGLSVAAVSDAAFPARDAFRMIKNVIDYFNQEVPDIRWKDLTQDSDLGIPVKSINEALQKLEKTAEIQKELDEVREIMQDNIDKLLQRDQDLDILLKQSDDLSAATKIMVKQSKELNSNCPDCIIL